jgi:THO complex subunit 2
MSTWESGCIVLRPILYSSLCRLLRLLIQNKKSTNGMEKDDETTMKLLNLFILNYFLPSLGLFVSNPALSMEIWNVLELLPYRTRYSFYESWRGNGLERMALKTNKPLWLMEGELLIGKDARYALKRLSKDTIRDMSRAVAKCCHSHPLVVFMMILN